MCPKSDYATRYQSLALFRYHTVLSQQEKNSFRALCGPPWHGFRSCEKAYRRGRMPANFLEKQNHLQSRPESRRPSQNLTTSYSERETELPLDLLMWTDLIPGFVNMAQWYRLLQNDSHLLSTGSWACPGERWVYLHVIGCCDCIFLKGSPAGD